MVLGHTHHRPTLNVCLFAFSAFLIGVAARGQEPAAGGARPTCPLAGFEAWHYPNGLNVWFKNMPNASTVSILPGARMARAHARSL